MKYLFFCAAYSNIVPILSIIDRLENDIEIRIVTFHKSIKKFLDAINNKRYDVMHIEMDHRILSKNPLFYLRLFSYKRELFEKYFKDVKGYKIYFFFKYFLIFVFYFIKRLSKSNDIFFYDCDPTYLENPNFNFLILFEKIIARFYFGVDINIYDFEYISISEISKNFFIENNINIIDPSLKIEKMEIVMSKISNFNGLQNKKVLFVTNDSVTNNIISKKDYINTENKIVEIFLSKYEKEEIVVKPHPRLPKRYGILKEGFDIIPEYIPAEFLFCQDFEYIVGIYSNSLLTAKKYSNAKIIALINLFKFTSGEFQRKVVNGIFQKEVNNRFYLPKSFEELERILEEADEKDNSSDNICR